MYSLLLLCLFALNAITVLITIIVSILSLLATDFIAVGSLASRIVNIDATYPSQNYSWPHCDIIYAIAHYIFSTESQCIAYTPCVPNMPQTQVCLPIKRREISFLAASYWQHCRRCSACSAYLVLELPFSIFTLRFGCRSFLLEKF